MPVTRCSLLATWIIIYKDSVIIDNVYREFCEIAIVVCVITVDRARLDDGEDYGVQGYMTLGQSTDE